jgi:TonB family protein
MQGVKDMNLGGRAKVPQFALLSHRQDPRPFGASFIFQIALLLFIAVLPRAYEVQTQTPHKQYTFTPLTAYKTVPVHMQQVVHVPKIATPKLEVVAKLTTPPEFHRPVEKIEEVKPVEVKSAKFDLAPVKVAVPKQPKIIRTGLLEGSSAPVTLKMPVQKVQTGGFGDPNGVAGIAKSDARLTVARVGSFDLPGGTTGRGNGTGGSHGISGTVASAGFGNGVATGTGGPGGRGNGLVRTGSFGDATAVASGSGPRRSSSDNAHSAVEIISKPNPIYTDEARRRHVEGDVLLEVDFTADGQIRVRRVVRGLGYGLDDAAVHAAEHIRFKPAQRDGRSLDVTAMLHITFQLAE